MEAVVKVGGSLAEDPESLRALCHALGALAKRHKILIMPGGGRFADVVREADRTFSLPDATAHKMAILGMDQFGLLLSAITPNSRTTYALGEARRLSAAGALPIFLPSRLMFREDPLERSWDVTSDSIAAYVADSARAKKLILATDVDGIFTDDPKRNPGAKLLEKLPASELLNWNKKTSVDRSLPKILSKTRLDCRVVNGKHPERVEAILSGRQALCTQILV